MQPTKLERWRRIAALLPRKPPGVTATALRQALEAKTGYTYQQKMIKRDLEAMDEAQNPPVRSEGEGASQRYWIAEYFKGFDVAQLSLSAAVTLALTLRELGELLPDTVKQELQVEQPRAQKLLERYRHDPITAWLEHVRVVPRMHPLMEPTVKPEVVGAVKEALLSRRKIELVYAPAPRADQPRRQKVHQVSILGLVRQHPAFTLVVYKPGKPVFVINLDRIVSGRVLLDPAQRPHGFTLDDYLQRGHLHYPMSDPPQSLVLQLEATPGIAQVWRDAPLGEDQRILKEDATRVTLSVTVPDTFALRAYLRGFGADVEVLAPADLRAEFELEANRAMARYRRGRRRTPPSERRPSPVGAGHPLYAATARVMTRNPAAK